MHVATYDWADPVAAREPFPVYPGATVLPEQTEIVRRARALLPNGSTTPRLALFETDAPLDAVAAHFAKLYASADGTPAPVVRGSGDHAKDEAALEPLLAKLGVRFTPGVARGSFRTALIAGDEGRPTISLQRPWRDFSGDRLVDRTLIMISE